MTPERIFALLVAATLIVAAAAQSDPVRLPSRSVVERIVAGPSTTVAGNEVVSIAARLEEVMQCQPQFPACRRPDCTAVAHLGRIFYTRPAALEVCVDQGGIGWRRVVMQ